MNEGVPYCSNAGTSSQYFFNTCTLATTSATGVVSFDTYVKVTQPGGVFVRNVDIGTSTFDNGCGAGTFFCLVFAPTSRADMFGCSDDHHEYLDDHLFLDLVYAVDDLDYVDLF